MTALDSPTAPTSVEAPPMHDSPFTTGRFERVLRSGAFAVTAELAPPDSADAGEVHRQANPDIARAFRYERDFCARGPG